VTLDELRAAHARYHDTGLCYGDSHASFEARERELSEAGTAVCSKCHDRVRIDPDHGGLVIHYDDGSEWCDGEPVLDAGPLPPRTSPPLTSGVSAAATPGGENR
jgi:hypothetical protein